MSASRTAAHDGMQSPFDRSWRRAWAALGAVPPAGLGERLAACYAEPHRQYHTLQHLGECIGCFESAIDLARHPGEIEVAVWFHDAIYEPQQSDNELQSASWAAKELQAAGLPARVAERVHALVMATRHAALPETDDERILVDVDLSILGAQADRYAQYAAQVRGEYAWVPGWIFRRKRKALLREFLAREPIYATPRFRDRLEARARGNLEDEIRKL